MPESTISLNCFEPFMLCFLLTAVVTTDTIPQRPAIFLKGTLATMPAPVKLVPMLAEDIAVIELPLQKAAFLGKCYCFLVSFSHLLAFNFYINFLTHYFVKALPRDSFQVVPKCGGSMMRSLLVSRTELRYRLTVICYAC